MKPPTCEARNLGLIARLPSDLAMSKRVKAMGLEEKELVIPDRQSLDTLKAVLAGRPCQGLLGTLEQRGNSMQEH